MDMNKPLEMLHYLNWNKSVHTKGLIQNIIAIPLLSVTTALGFGIAIPFLLEELFSLFINFQCINNIFIITRQNNFQKYLPFSCLKTIH